MANVYVYSGAVGAANGTSWTDAYTTVAASFSGRSHGDIIYVAHDHAETQATSMTWTVATGNYIYCVNRAGSVPPAFPTDLRTTATVSTTGASTITITGTTGTGHILECYGINFSSGSGSSSASMTIGSGTTISQSYVLCTFKLNTTNGSTNFLIGSTTSFSNVFMEQCSFQFGAASQQLRPQTNRWVWTNSTALVSGSSVPIAMFTPQSNTSAVHCEGVDFEAVSTSILSSVNTAVSQYYVFKNCRFNASAAKVTSGAPSISSGIDATFISSESSDIMYGLQRSSIGGTQTNQTTFKMTGGSSYGGIGYAAQITTPAATTPPKIYEAIPIVIFNDQVGGSLTVSVEGCWASGTRPTNADIWMDVYYPGISGESLASKSTTGKIKAVAATTYSAGSGTWSGSPGSTFVMSTAITPAEVGPVTVYIKMALASSTIYVDQKPVIT